MEHPRLDPVQVEELALLHGGGDGLGNLRDVHRRVEASRRERGGDAAPGVEELVRRDREPRLLGELPRRRPPQACVFPVPVEISVLRLVHAAGKREEPAEKSRAWIAAPDEREKLAARPSAQNDRNGALVEPAHNVAVDVDSGAIPRSSRSRANPGFSVS